MGRVEETDKYLNEMKNEACEVIRSAGSESIIIAQTIALQTAANEAIAKNLAQLADDIHFLRETIAKELEGEKSKSSGPTCLDCKYSDTMRYVDKDGIVNRDVEWCQRKHQKINFDDKPVCDYFKPVEAEG